MICEREVDMMLDKGSPISLIEESVAAAFSREGIIPSNVIAADNSIPVLGCIILTIQLGKLTAKHSLVVVCSLISPVILGLDFFQTNGIVLDFTSKALNTTLKHFLWWPLLPLVDASRKAKAKICAIAMLTEPSEEVVNDCAVPLFGESVCSGMTCLHVLHLHFYLSLHNVSKALLTHDRYTSESATPANYHTAVESQIQAMLKEGSIEESSSLWLATAVFVRKKTGDIRICVDYRELNKRTGSKMPTHFLVPMKCKTNCLGM